MHPWVGASASVADERKHNPSPTRPQAQTLSYGYLQVIILRYCGFIVCTFERSQSILPLGPAEALKCLQVMMDNLDETRDSAAIA